jgi:hypothetical protein
MQIGYGPDKHGDFHPLASGSMGIHPIGRGLQFIRATSSHNAPRNNASDGTRSNPGVERVFFRTSDAAVVKFGDRLPFPTPIHGAADLSQGARETCLH